MLSESKSSNKVAREGGLAKEGHVYSREVISYWDLNQKCQIICHL